MKRNSGIQSHASVITLDIGPKLLPVSRHNKRPLQKTGQSKADGSWVTVGALALVQLIIGLVGVQNSPIVISSSPGFIVGLDQEGLWNL